MNLLFQGMGQVFKYEIDRTNKKLKIASSKTFNQMRDMPWKFLFDKGKEKEQEEHTDKLNDNAFKGVIVTTMMQNGYKLISGG